MPRRCLICEKKITMEEDEVCDATVWISHGNNRSLVYESGSEDSCLELLICDDCLLKKRKFIAELVVKRTRKVVMRRQAIFDGAKAMLQSPQARGQSPEHRASR